MKSLISKNYCEISSGRIAYVTAGPEDKPPVLFVHGIPTSSYLWRHVLRFLQNDFHCIAPDLMGLGDTEVDPDKTAFHMEAQAEMLLELMTALGHKRFALVCHDQGGAAAQIVATRQPDRLTAFVITDCVCFDNWPVPVIRRLQTLSRIKPLSAFFTHTGLSEKIETSTRLSAFRRGVYDPSRLSAETIHEFLRPARGDRRARESFRKFLLAGHPRYTEKVVPMLRELTVPTLIVWAADDRYLSPSWGRRLAEEIPGTRRFELVPFCGHFWQEEKPAEFAAHIGRFLADVLGEEAGEVASPAAEETDDKKCKRLPVVEAAPGARLQEER